METNPVGAGGASLQSYSQDQSAIVKVGESVTDVAQRLGVSEEELKALNPQIDGGNLQPGQEIRLPQGAKRPSQDAAIDSGDQSPALLETGTRRFESDLDSIGVQYQLGAHSFRHAPVQVAQATPAGSKQQSGIDQLEEAASKGDIAKMQALIKSGVDLNGTSSKDGWTPLMAAAASGNQGAMELLLKSGAKVDAAGADGQTALMKAAYTGQDQSVKFLLKNHADINHADNNGKTALLVAEDQNHSGMVAVLIARGANVNAQDNNGKTAMMLAAERGDAQEVTTLANAGADLNKKDISGKTAMMLAAAQGDKDVVLTLAERKADPDVQDPVTKRTAIMDLITNLPEGQKLDEKEAETLLAASSKPDQGDAHQRSALMEAAANGQDKMVEVWAKSGRANVDLQDGKGRTALMDLDGKDGHAQVDLDAAKALIGASKNLNLEDRDHRTALIDMASRNGDHGADVVKELNKAGADLNKKDKYGHTALMQAGVIGNKWAVRFLLDQNWSGAGTGELRKADASISAKGQTALAQVKAFVGRSVITVPSEKAAYQEIIDMLQKSTPKPRPTPPPPPPDWKP
jgi:uncharacterized protein